jgi:uncharacterized protein (TIGR00297 family)
VLTAGETKRKLVHIGVGGFALLLRFLDWREAAALALGAFLFNWQILPRVGGKQLWRGGEQAKGYPLGILLYPLSVLGLCLYFRHDLAKAAAVWGLLAVGDGMAAVLGQALRGPRLPWNPGKGWVGFASFLVFGTLAASFLMVWTLRLPLTAVLAPRVLALTLPLTVICALVESLPTTLDDNLTVPLTGAVALTLLAQADFAALLAAPGLGRRLLPGLAVNGVVALGAKLAGSIDIPGALSAIFIGTVITGTLGLRGFALMAAFFVVGSLVTRLGYRVKAARGIAQERGGARGWRNAWANGGVAALLALMTGAAPSDMRFLYLLAYAAAVATAAADTCSSEVGKAYGRRTFLITTLHPVPPGTEGAVSLEGTLGGLLGGGLVAGLGAALGLYPWLAGALVAVAGLLGSLAESVLGTVAERKGWLDNDLLNALNTALGAVFVVFLLRLFPLSS